MLPGAFTDTTSGPSPVTCEDHRLRWNGKAVRLVMPSTCLHDGDHGAVRVAVLTENGSDSVRPPEGRSATRCIARG
ncbi:hypothetical protein [Nocardioides sp. Arc9.136]|uniref:hypothetical protein n=1 Tax=Nocardioides sp. Arc9.136 TaxID=2996826 RepID=UPI0026667953|nr:hypothetical protein [Nocardioides sp. Arc9.136]WKN50329.1 hypothetical protein OSR43_09420 [Nocardioides sp. Arc9.136]